MIRSIRFLCLWCVPFLTVPIPLPSVGAQSPDPVSGTKRPIKVADAIGMVRLADSYYFQTGSSEGRVAHFSPDGKKFVVLLKQSDLGRNINTFSLLLFRTADVFHSPAPHLLLTMSSSSNRDAIHAVKWLADSKTLAFLGENPGELPQVYTIDIRLRRVEKLTNHVTAVTSYDITPDGRELIFGADLPTIRSAAMVPVRRDGIVITSQELDDILAGNFSNTGESKLFIERLGRPAVEIPLRDAFYEGGPLSLSPDGRYAMVGSHVREIPNIWPEYRADPLVHAIVVSRRRKGETVPLLRYLLVDTKDGSITPLLNTPMLGIEPFRWALDGRAVLIEKTYLPLDSPDSAENEERKKTRYDVEVDLPTRVYRKLPKKDWPRLGTRSAQLKVSLQEDINTPPRIRAFDIRTNQDVMLLNLNPQFNKLKFGESKTFEWKVHGIDLLGGLYLPPDYDPAKRYPLVIQTHGFVRDQFSMDGRSEWSSGFAARPLAANAIIVLQGYDFKHEEDHDRIGSDRSLGATEAQSFKNFNLEVFSGAADYLDQLGIIDRNRVGIVGFSRTVCFVAYTLTHSSYPFAAASLVDGIDCGYFQYLAFPASAQGFDALNGGVAPFGEGLKEWLKESPGFNLDKVHTPVRLVALNPPSVLEMWEWFAGLTLQRKPVDLVEIPNGVHLLKRPWDRRIAMQGIVDWFRFWLKDEEDPAPRKREQYLRWRELKEESRIKSSPEDIEKR